MGQGTSGSSASRWTAIAGAADTTQAYWALAQDRQSVLAL
jgi:hypothetical protein